MAEIVLRIEGNGLKRLARTADRLGQRGATEMKRGLISGGRKATTQVKRSLVSQTGIKSHSVSRRTRGYYDAARNAWVITGRGKGVPLDEVKGVRAGKMKPRDPANQPRDAMGRFAQWPQDKRFAAGLVRASVWNKPRRFAYSYVDDGRYFSAPPDKPRHTLYGPAVYKELVKGQSAATFLAGRSLVLNEIERRIVKASGGVLS